LHLEPELVWHRLSLALGLVVISCHAELYSGADP